MLLKLNIAGERSEEETSEESEEVPIVNPVDP